MTMYGASNTGLGVFKTFGERQLAESVLITERFEEDPQLMFTMLKQRQDYLQLGTDLMNLILKNSAQLQI